MDARARTILNGTERNGTERNEIPMLSERRFRKERKVNGTERNQFGNFFLTRTVCIVTGYFSTGSTTARQEIADHPVHKRTTGGLELDRSKLMSVA